MELQNVSLPFILQKYAKNMKPIVGNTANQILTPKLNQNLKHPTGWSEPLKIGDSKYALACIASSTK